MDRRLFLKLALASSVAGCTSVQRQPTATLDDRIFTSDALVNNSLTLLPDHLLGAKAVHKYPVSQAKYCLIHIRQLHLGKNPSKKDYAKVKKVQDRIYLVLNELISMYGLNRIYYEGVTEKREEDMNRSAQTSMLVRHGSKEANLECSKDDAFYHFERFRDYRAAYRIATDRPVHIVAAASSNLEEAANDYRHKTRGLGLLRLFIDRTRAVNTIMEDREDFLLKKVSDNDDSVSVVVYGGQHAWGGKKSCGSAYYPWDRLSIKDNIYCWNRLHPDKKFSLIEIACK